ncbi:hypothetical protein R9208_05970 [Flammeovirgaceae bacterium SG7u.132]|nr:hypothetical protein [Flammeovirgaceae bacterium SG7u.132]
MAENKTNIPDLETEKLQLEIEHLFLIEPHRHHHPVGKSPSVRASLFFRSET